MKNTIYRPKKNSSNPSWVESMKGGAVPPKSELIARV